MPTARKGSPRVSRSPARKPIPWPRVTVLWRDCYALPSDTWVAPEELLNRDCLIETRGFLVGQDDNFLLLCRDVDSEDLVKVGGVTAIPHGCIVHITTEKSPQCNSKSRKP